MPHKEAFITFLGDTFQHQEKNGVFFWNLCVKVLLKFLNLSVVPKWPLDLKIRSLRHKESFKNSNLSTKTLGICTNCRGLFPSFNACERFNICPLITDICFSNICLSKPLSVCKQFYCRIYFVNFPLFQLTMNSPYISSQMSWTKFMSLILSRTRSLVSWEKGI